MAEQRLVRDKAGSYHTPDKRFTVTKEGPRWWLRDAKITDELGMMLTRGPFDTLEAVNEAIATAGEPEPAKPKLRVVKSSRRKT
jgi:hypothetical protein